MKMADEKILELPMEKRAEMAFGEAVGEVMQEHIRRQIPIYISRSGRIVELSAEEVRMLYPPEGDVRRR